MYNLVMVDTDGLKFFRQDGKMITEEEIEGLISKINAGLPQPMNIENDGNFDGVVIVKTKNYITKIGDDVKIKGSGLKASMKEQALKEFLSFSLRAIIDNKDEEIEGYYNKLAGEIKGNNFDINMWSKKITVTKAVLNPKRTTEQRILDSLSGEHIQEGDKLRVFFKTPTELCLDKKFDGVYDRDKLYEKLFKTVKVLAPVLDMERFPNYKLKKNKTLLEEL